MRSIQTQEFHPDVESEISRENTTELRKQLAEIYSRQNLGLNQRELSSDTTLTYKDSVIVADTSSVSVTLTLAYANSWGTYKTPIIVITKKSEANTLTISPQGSDNLYYWLDGEQVSGSITPTGSVILVANGASTWYAIAGNFVEQQESTNAIINGCFRVNQRGTFYTSTSTYVNNDDAYTLDRWYILSDGNDVIDVGQYTTSSPYGWAIGLDVETANKKFGIAQIIESKNCIGLISNNVTLTFDAYVSSLTNLDNIKAAIIAWSGVADTVTSDIISTWNVEGTNPTLIANATYENTPANLGVTTSWQRFSVKANIDTLSTQNIIVFIWSDVTTTAVGGADILYIRNVQLKPGLAVRPFQLESYEEVLAACQRYYEKSFYQGLTPAQNTGDFTSPIHFYASGSQGNVNVFYKVTKLRTPSVTTYNTSAANANWRDISAGADRALTIANSSDTGFSAYSGAFVAGNHNYVHWTANAEL